MRKLATSTFVIAAAALAAQACSSTSNSTPEPIDGGGTNPDPTTDGGAPAAGDIPPDPGGTAPEPTINNLKPAASFSLPDQAGGAIRVTLLGLIDPVTSQPVVFKANESVWITEDGVLKGIKVTQASGNNQLPFDIVFTVDNSGSMGEEANGVAEKIVAFANLVAASGASARIGVVGYSGRVTGAINFTDAPSIDAYLKREGVTGTGRTVGFGGADADALQARATADVTADGGVPSSENAIAAIVFAENALAWRPNAQRVFINFTDEPTQPGGKEQWKTKTLCARWKPANGTIHTVWSGSPGLDVDAGATRWTEGTRENPADLSACTPGGVVKSIKSDATDLDLTTLPLTDALRNSALVEFKSKDANGTHEVSIVVKNGTSADGKTVFPGVRYTK